VEKDVFRRYAVKKLILSLALVLVLMAVSESVAAEFRSFTNRREGRIEINRNRTMYNDASELIRYDHMATLEKKFPEGRVSFSSGMDTTLEFGEYSLPVRVCLTDEAYPDFSGLRIIRGAYFSDKAVKRGRNVAVISRDLAERLFMSLNAVGNEITLLNETYVIVGLYEPPKTMLALLGSDGTETVYVPFTSYMAYEDLPLDTVSIDDAGLAGAGFKQSMMKDILRKDLGVRAEAYRITDYDKSETMVSQWLALFQFLVALWTLALLLGSAGRILRELKDFVRAGLQEDYLTGFLKKRFVAILSFVGKILGLTGLSAIVVIFAKPRVFIPAQYLPADNIFDIRFYWARIREAIQVSNAMTGYVPTPMEHCFHASLAVGFVLFLLLIPAFLSLGSALRLLKSLAYPVKRLLLLFLLSSMLAFAALLLLWASGLFQLVIGAKSIACLGLFYLVYILKKGVDMHISFGSANRNRESEVTSLFLFPKVLPPNDSHDLCVTETVNHT